MKIYDLPRSLKADELVSLADAKGGFTLHPSLLLDYPINTWFYFLHHDWPTELLTPALSTFDSPLAERLHYVLRTKPETELYVRLAAMRPVSEENSKICSDEWERFKDAVKNINVSLELNEAANEALIEWRKNSLFCYDRDWPDHPPIIRGSIFT